MLELLAGTGLGLASHMWETAFDSAVNDHYDSEHQRREFNYNEKSSANTQIRNLENLQNSPSAYVQGLKKAGINPALAVSGQVPVGSSTALATSGSGHAVPGVSSGTAGAMAALQAKKQMEVLDSEIELNESAADKNRAEARGQHIDNQHTESRDRVLNQGFVTFLDEMKETTDNPFIRGYLESVIEGNESYDLGSIQGFADLFFDFSQKERDRELDYIANFMRKKVMRLAVSDDRIAEAEARRPYNEAMELYKRIAYMNMQIYALGQEASLTENKRSLLNAQVHNLEQLTKQIYHRDPAAMWQAGDYSAFLSSLGYDGIEAAANGVGFGAGAAIGSRIGGNATGAFRTRLEAGEKAAEKQTKQVFGKTGRLFKKLDDVSLSEQQIQSIDNRLKKANLSPSRFAKARKQAIIKAKELLFELDKDGML